MKTKGIVLLSSAILVAVFLFLILNKTNNFIHKWYEDNSNSKLTVMIYCDADSDLENDIVHDIEAMKEGYVDDENLNLIVLISRSEEYSNDSNVFGENFSDTRMYKIERNKAIRISGGSKFYDIKKDDTYKANLKDPETLKKFIDSCKDQYTADKYALIIAGHGTGAKNVCSDESNSNYGLYTASVSDVLTKDESVDVLVYDACLMGTAETAYQYRPGNGGFEADIMIASPSKTSEYGYDYKNIFSHLKRSFRNKVEEKPESLTKIEYFDPSTITDYQFAALILESQINADKKTRLKNEVFSCYDLSKIENVKNSIDKLSIMLWQNQYKDAIEKIRGSGNDVPIMHYFQEHSKYEWLNYPYFDLYDLCEKINQGDDFNSEIRQLAEDVMINVDDMIIYSYSENTSDGFKSGKNGISIFLPDGDKMYKDVNTKIESPEWELQKWYNAEDKNIINSEYYYGKLSWCGDGRTQKINDVGNWFELLDCWFDDNNDENGGFNGYQW